MWKQLLFLVVKVGNLLRNIYLKLEIDTWILCLFPQNLQKVCLFHHTVVSVKAGILCGYTGVVAVEQDETGQCPVPWSCSAFA